MPAKRRKNTAITAGLEPSPDSDHDVREEKVNPIHEHDFYARHRRVEEEITEADGDVVTIKSVLKKAYPQMLMDGSKPIHMVAQNNHLTAIADLLKDNKTDPDVTNDRGETPLHLAAIYGNAASMRALLERGAAPNVKDKDGNNALHLVASRENSADAIKVLTKWGVDPNAKNLHDQTPLYIAAALDKPDNMKDLRRGGADYHLGKVGNRGWTIKGIVAERKKASDEARKIPSPSILNPRAEPIEGLNREQEFGIIHAKS